MGVELISSLRIYECMYNMNECTALPSRTNDSNILVVIRILYTRHRINHPTPYFCIIHFHRNTDWILFPHHFATYTHTHTHKVSQCTYTGQKHTGANKSKTLLSTLHMCGGVMYVVHRSNTAYIYTLIFYEQTASERVASRIYKHRTYKTDVVKPSQAVAFFLIELVNLKQWTVYKS